jgi:hypothetical protein
MEDLIGGLGYLLMGYFLGMGTMCLMFITGESRGDPEEGMQQLIDR